MFGDSPNFDSLLIELEKLEREINGDEEISHTICYFLL